MIAGSCLLGTDPRFSEPERTRPILIPHTISPDPRLPFFIQPTDTEQTFTAGVISEDAGDDVEVRLLFNYGAQGAAGRPYLASIQGNQLAPASLADGERTASVTWDRAQFGFASGAGCYRFTLMVGHDFENQGCPEPDDYDAVSWLVILCDLNGCPTDLTCPPTNFDCATNLPPIDGPGGN